ncbi:MAG: PAS domain S-box protein [Ignavibacteriales bacterium]|nr:PAS domain S-box protein [Ignavibacteriales bacterium]
MIAAKTYELARDYKAALRSYLAGAGEPALQRAFELGRKAVEEGMGSIDLALVHHDALANNLVQVPNLEEGMRVAKLGSNFFAETLAPIEMSHRGFQDAILTLKASEERYRTVVETALDVIYTLSVHGTLTSLNPVFEAITGWSREEWIGKHFIGLIHHEDLGRALSMFEKTLRGEIPEMFELRVVAKSGSILVGEFKATPQFQDGNVVGVLGIARDITERKRAEERIREQAALLDMTHDAIVVCDIAGKVTYWNKNAEQFFGFIAAEALGKHVSEAMMASDAGEIPGAFDSVLERGNWLGTIVRKTRNGKEITIESRWMLITNGHSFPASVFIVNTDVTERKNFEARLMRARRMESLGTLASGIAHDLNDVLSPILLGVQSLGRVVQASECPGIVQSIESSITRGAKMIKQILTFARGIEGEKAPVQFAALFQELKEFASGALSKSIDVRIHVPSDLWTLHGDITQLQQLFMSLCVYANSAMPQGGVFTVTAENVQFDQNYAGMDPEAKAGPYILLSVTDTGKGIPKDHIERIFDPFFTTTASDSHLGISLSTVLSIVKSHEGFVRVDSEVGKGTQFRVYLPAIQTHELAVPHSRKRELPLGGGEAILVVDDEAAIREITKATLETYGYKVLTASDGAEAVALFVEHNDEIKLVLTDIMMPCMNGDTAIRAILQVDEHAKIIATSGLTSREQIEDVIGRDGISFLPKPYTADKLVHTISEVLRKS